jgi:hypothetical protein
MSQHSIFKLSDYRKKILEAYPEIIHWNSWSTIEAYVDPEESKGIPASLPDHLVSDFTYIYNQSLHTKNLVLIHPIVKQHIRAMEWDLTACESLENQIMTIRNIGCQIADRIQIALEKEENPKVSEKILG